MHNSSFKSENFSLCTFNQRDLHDQNWPFIESAATHLLKLALFTHAKWRMVDPDRNHESIFWQDTWSIVKSFALIENCSCNPIPCDPIHFGSATKFSLSFLDLKISRPQDLKISRSQDLKTSWSQDLMISRSQDLKTSRSQDIMISRSQDLMN
jgi:hypothetical protein